MRLDSFTDRLIARIDELLRGTCVADDCFKPADLSDSRTSLAYCRAHYFLKHLETFPEQVSRLRIWYGKFVNDEHWAAACIPSAVWIVYEIFCL